MSERRSLQSGYEDLNSFPIMRACPWHLHLLKTFTDSFLSSSKLKQYSWTLFFSLAIREKRVPFFLWTRYISWTLPLTLSSCCIACHNCRSDPRHGNALTRRLTDVILCLATYLPWPLVSSVRASTQWNIQMKLQSQSSSLKRSESKLRAEASIIASKVIPTSTCGRQSSG